MRHPTVEFLRHVTNQALKMSLPTLDGPHPWRPMANIIWEYFLISVYGNPED